MPDNVNRNNSPERDFWHAYRKLVSGHGIPASQIDWIVRWAQDFAKSRKNIKLRDRQPADVQSYIEKLANRRGIVDWEFRVTQYITSLLSIVSPEHLHIAIPEKDVPFLFYIPQVQI